MAEATRLRLRVTPGARRSGVVGRHGEAWKLRVAAAPERGRANAEVVRVLAEALDVPERAIAVVSGHGSRDKVVELAGLDPDEAERRLERVEADLRHRPPQRPRARLQPGTYVVP